MSVQPEQEREKRPYALHKLSGAAHVITSIADALPAYRMQIGKYFESDRLRAKAIYDELAKERSKLSAVIAETRLPLLELEEEKAAAYAGTLSTQLAAFNLMTPNYTQLVQVLGSFANALPTEQTVNASVIGRLMNNVRMGHYPTDLENVGHILRGIMFPEGVTTNLLDPCCGTGAALKKLAMGNNCYTYGIELDENRATEAQNTLHRVGFGSFFGSQISREAFHVIFLNPPYLSVLTEGGGRSRDEKKFLIESIPHLMMGGLLVYIVPYYRLTSDICRVLCDNFTDLSVHRFTDKEFGQFKQVAVLGLRHAKMDGSVQADALERSTYDAASIPCITVLDSERYPLPAVSKPVELFKGAQFNELELARQLKKSDSFDKLFAKSSLDSVGRRPPLPLNIGQVGLIGGSGMVNGLIDCDYPHIIKGRIIKVRKVVEEPVYGNRGAQIATETRVTIANKMIFNLLTPDGFQSLA